MSKVLVTGAGRSGTNLTAAMVRATGLFEFFPKSGSEDRKFLSMGRLPARYLGKLSSGNKGVNKNSVGRMLRLNEDLLVVFTVRHPIDTCLSAIARTQPKGSVPFTDSEVKEMPPGATLPGSIKVVRAAQRLFAALALEFPDRVLKVRMEDSILDFESQAKRLAVFLGFSGEIILQDVLRLNAKPQHKKRYGLQLRTEQVGLYKRHETIFDGFFAGSGYLEVMRKELAEVACYFGYEIGDDW